jgi:BlaI family transcriptional regulator, penicillinase repressor
MARHEDHHLSRRERQIMDIIHGKGEATALEVNEALPEPPSYSAVRAMLRILEEKGRLKHRKDGARYVYLATESREKASRSALKRLVTTFFGGSVEQTIAALLDASDTKLSEAESAKLQKLINEAKKEGR